MIARLARFWHTYCMYSTRQQQKGGTTREPVVVWWRGVNRINQEKSCEKRASLNKFLNAFNTRHPSDIWFNESQWRMKFPVFVYTSHGWNKPRHISWLNNLRTVFPWKTKTKFSRSQNRGERKKKSFSEKESKVELTKVKSTKKINKNKNKPWCSILLPLLPFFLPRPCAGGHCSFLSQLLSRGVVSRWICKYKKKHPNSFFSFRIFLFFYVRMYFNVDHLRNYCFSNNHWFPFFGFHQFARGPC